jgi:glycosyltransferase involved in cell wall biosynthesis
MFDIKPRKIMIFEPYLRTVNKSEGNTRHIVFIFQYMNRNCFEPILVSPVLSDLFAEISRMGGRCYQVPAPARLQPFGGVILRQSLPGRLWAALSLAWYNGKVLNFLRRRRPAIIQCHNARALLMVGLAAKMAGVPVIWYVKGVLNNPLLDRLCFRLADRVLFQNRANRDNRYPHLVKRHAGKIGILKNGIDLAAAIEAGRGAGPSLAQELRLNPDNLNIIVLGEVCPRKGTAYLLEAMAKMQAAVPKVSVYLVGDNSAPEHQEYRKHLHDVVARRRLDNIHFTGWRRDCCEILALMDLLVLPSTDEGVPKAILEAMALGKPVVASRIGGIPEVVLEGKTGLLVAPQDSDELAQAIITLAQDSELRQKMGALAKKVALREYAIQDNITGMERIYLDILEENQQKTSCPSPLLRFLR